MTRVGYALHGDTMHAVKPETLETRQRVALCGTLLYIATTNEREPACQRCRRALGLPNIIDARRRARR